jgi:hypothetical protein
MTRAKQTNYPEYTRNSGCTKELGLGILRFSLGLVPGQLFYHGRPDGIAKPKEDP